MQMSSLHDAVDIPVLSRYTFELLMGVDKAVGTTPPRVGGLPDCWMITRVKRNYMLQVRLIRSAQGYSEVLEPS